MTPSAYAILDALPMTPNKKVDRKALPAPVPVKKEAAKPADAVETRILAMWKEMLAVESLGTKDNFYSVGGHSLMAIRLVDRINAEFGAELPLNEFFGNPTVEGLAKLLRARTTAAASAVQRVERATVAMPVPAPPNGLHRGLFCIQEGEPGGGTQQAQPPGVWNRLCGALERVSRPVQKSARYRQVLRSSFGWDVAKCILV